MGPQFGECGSFINQNMKKASHSVINLVVHMSAFGTNVIDYLQHGYRQYLQKFFFAKKQQYNKRKNSCMC